jgi:hypothetical protein
MEGMEVKHSTFYTSALDGNYQFHVLVGWGGGLDGVKE